MDKEFPTGGPLKKNEGGEPQRKSAPKEFRGGGEANKTKAIRRRVNRKAATGKAKDEILKLSISGHTKG